MQVLVSRHLRAESLRVFGDPPQVGLMRGNHFGDFARESLHLLIRSRKLKVLRKPGDGLKRACRRPVFWGILLRRQHNRIIG